MSLDYSVDIRICDACSVAALCSLAHSRSGKLPCSGRVLFVPE
jgi:hypothetical protein